MLSSLNYKSKPEVIFVIGGPGSGKGTQCELLQREKGYCHISTGDLIRNLLKEEKIENKQLSEIRTKVQRGELLDDAMITELLAKEIQKNPEAKSFLIDGYPRTVEQLTLFEKTIQPCNKILFFDTTEAIMQSRLLGRAQIEHRDDDNEVTIAKRIKLYQEKTLPIIDYIKQNHAEKLIQIDASGKVEEIAAKIKIEIEKSNNLVDISALEFLTCYLKSGNFYDAIDTLENRYHTTDFKVALSFFTLFYVVQNKEDVKTVLNAKAVAGFQNHNFDVAHGHYLNINAVPAFIDGKINPIWQSIHTGILHSIGNAQSVKQLVAKHFHKFLDKPKFSLDVSFESFMESFWCEFMFGEKADAAKFSQTRAKLISALKYSYYDSRLKNIPYVGTQACKLYGYLKNNEFAEVDKQLLELLKSSDNGLFAKFREDLLKNPQFPRELVDTAILDNAFVLILALDFIQNAMYETLKIVVQSGLKTTEARKLVYGEGLHEAFLFPFRTRVPQEELKLKNAVVPKGTPVYINLVKAGLYHSAGPRTCAGIGVTQWIKEAIWDQLKDVEFDLIDTTYPPEREALSHSRDVPISPERLEVSWHYSRDYLQKILPHYEFKGVKEFFDVLKVFENPWLSHYVTTSFKEQIEKLNLDKSTLCIATPEVRGIPAAAVVAEALQVPLVIIRKENKIPGEVVSKKYSNAYSTEVIQLSATADVKGRNVIFIDDGIASGGTTVACCELLKQMGGNVPLVLGIINHTYKEKSPELKSYNIQTLFDFANKAPEASNSNARNMFSLFKPAAVEAKPEPANEYKLAM